MTPLLPSTQLLLALWLLATVAPAATALLNGSVVPFAVAVAETRVKATAREAAGTVVVESKSEKDDATLDWLACDGESWAQTFPSVSPSAVNLCQGGDILPARSSSVLQTDLQRHRPKSA